MMITSQLMNIPLYDSEEFYLVCRIQDGQFNYWLLRQNPREIPGNGAAVVISADSLDEAKMTAFEVAKGWL